MSQLFNREISVEDLTGRPTPALLQVCECGGETWVIYAIQIGGGSHPHVQCVKCGTSYCDGTCGDAAGLFRCPKCGLVSRQAADAQHGYCGACHEFTGTDTDELMHPSN
jgi:ribosomal protein S27AE